MLTCAALSGCAFSAVCPNGGPLSCFALSAAASSARHPDSGFLAGRRSWLVRGIADDLDFRPGSADIEGSWRFCRKVRPSSDGNPRRMASCRCRCGAVVDARGSNAREPVPRSEADRHRNRRRLGRSCLRGQSTPGALAPRPRRRLFGVERQASQSGGDDQAAASPSQAPSEELDVRLTGTNPSADRKRGPGSRLVTQGAPAHLKVRPPRAPRGQDVFLEWGPRLSPSSPCRTGPPARVGQPDVRQEMSATGAELRTETRPSHRSGWVPDLRPAGRPRRRHL
jgi:hypothetical protein